MFHEVRVISPEGNVKKVVQKNVLKRKHWKNFQKGEQRIGLLSTSQKPVPAWVKKNLDLMYPETIEVFS